jgi:ABC-type Zn uptake system ZnuABC Zn-binding protein ZnuA
MSDFSHFAAAPVARLIRFAAIIVLLCAALASPAGPARAQDSDPLKVVATFSILADWVQNAGGDNIELTTIVPAGGDAHTFDPNPEQVANIVDADLIFEIGLGFESWLEDMYDASGSSAVRVVVSNDMELLISEADHADEADDGHDAEGENHAEESHDSVGDGHSDEALDDDGGDHVDEVHEDDHGEYDPHIWGDVRNAIGAVAVISQHLSAADPDNAGAYEANAALYVAQLEDLHTYIETETQTIPEDRRKLVTTHDTFGYYADAYDFEIVGTALSSISTEGGDPPASEIAALVEAIEAESVPAIFAENVSNNDLIQVIADEAGVALADPLYTDALGEPGSDGDTYIAIMTVNTDAIVTALVS